MSGRRIRHWLHPLQIILIVFSAVGGILSVIQLLSIVLACCYANQISKFEDESKDHYFGDYDQGAGYRAPLATHSRPGTPQHSRHYDNNNETSC